LWVYWGQSIVIGGFSFLKILKLERFSTAGVRVNDRPVPLTAETRRNAAFFFLAHYGFFHLVYFLFLVTTKRTADADGFIHPVVRVRFPGESLLLLPP
jgi:hypothetical protein